MFCPSNPDKTLIVFICRSGVYCAANACIEQVIQHGEVMKITQCQSINAHTSHIRLTCSRQSRQSGGTGPSLFRTWFDIKFLLILLAIAILATKTHLCNLLFRGFLNYSEPSFIL